ncbi:MAG TPA: hypothetical protein VMW38_24135, partial [Terriglobia bacterium]|nr:hypothetical protein [Terriglobia bacterium]
MSLRDTGDWTFFEKSGGRMPPVPLRARYGRKKLAQGAVSGRSSGPPSPRRPPWVGVPADLHPLPQHLLGVGGEGRGEGV